MTMELIDRNKIEFSPIEIYNFDEHKREVTGMALFKDIEKIPTVKAIPLDEVEQVREEIQKRATLAMNERYEQGLRTALEIIDKLIKEYERED